MIFLKKQAQKKGRAQAMVEFAIALPVLLMLLYGIIETGRLLFLYSTVVTASRQAVRYGSATGEGSSANVFRYQDCDGIRAAAQRFAYFGQFDNIDIKYDTGPGGTEFGQCAGSKNTSIDVSGNSKRIKVTVTDKFYPILPKLLPFAVRNISASSARTILSSVSIEVEKPDVDVTVYKTETEIDFDSPDPSESNQDVTVQVTINNTDDPSVTPTGRVEITGADTNCTLTLNENGWGSCVIRFTSYGSKTITATYKPDDKFLASSDTEAHTVSKAKTITTITGDGPDPSDKNQIVTVVVSVTGGMTTPTGTVDVDAGGGINCVITLSNGTGSCTISFNNLGFKTITASYNGDSSHDTSNDTEVHEVIAGTPTPTIAPSITPTPTITSVATITPTPTITPTRVASCNLISHGAVTKSLNTMTMTIQNNNPFPITTGTGTVTWNNDKGHQTGADKTLNLQSITIGNATLGYTTVWTGNSNNYTETWTTPAIIPAGATVTITFAFHQTYNNFDGTEKISIPLLTPGCESTWIIS